MTAYHGGKQRVGKQLAEVIYDTSIKIESRGAKGSGAANRAGRGFQIKGYCEPFCGMLGVYQHIPALFQDHKPKLKYKAGDVNKSVILMWKAAQKGWKPPAEKISKKEFLDLKNSKPSAFSGFIGHVHAFRGVYFTGYFTHPKSKLRHSSQRVQDIASNLKNVSFQSGDYKKYSNLKNYIIYCDPPYAGTRQHYFRRSTAVSTGRHNKKVNLNFDSDEFWEWCEKMSKDNIVFVSEYKAPRNTQKIWSKNKEKLYILY